MLFYLLFAKAVPPNKQNCENFFVVSVRTNLKHLNKAVVITIENTQWNHATKRSA